MRIKVHNGTVPNGDTSLCGTCRHATIIRGRTLDEEIVQCEAVGVHATRVTFKVTSCNAHSDIAHPTYMQYLEDAWILQPGSKRRPAGFVRSRDLRQEQLREIMVELRHCDD
jgi:hypothetical protein